MDDEIHKIPCLRSIARVVYCLLIAPFKSFPGSENYWKQRYRSGGTSGSGSYHRLAEFKAEVLNSFVRDKQIRTIIEYGCGDGNQLRLLEYPTYVGFDVSPDAISQCKHLFIDDATKTFKLMNAYADETAQLTLSLDVIYHLVEDEVFSAYMKRLFDSSTTFVIVYSTDTDKQARVQAPHVKHRQFSRWIKQCKPEWKLIRHIPNRYPFTADEQAGSCADFYIYEKTGRIAASDRDSTVFFPKQDS